MPRDPLGAAATVNRLEATWTELAEAFPSEPKFLRDIVAIRSLIANCAGKVEMARKRGRRRRSLFRTSRTSLNIAKTWRFLVRY